MCYVYKTCIYILCTHTHKATVAGARRLLQYSQLPDKNSGNISRYIYTVFFAVFQNSHVFILLFLSEPQPVFCGTLFDKHRFKPHAIHEDHVRMNKLKRPTNDVPRDS